LTKQPLTDYKIEMYSQQLKDSCKIKTPDSFRYNHDEALDFEECEILQDEFPEIKIR